MVHCHIQLHLLIVVSCSRDVGAILAVLIVKDNIIKGLQDYRIEGLKDYTFSPNGVTGFNEGLHRNFCIVCIV